MISSLTGRGIFNSSWVFNLNKGIFSQEPANQRIDSNGCMLEHD